MSTKVVGVKLHSSGWWGSKRKSAGGAIVANALCTPAPAARLRARSTAAQATGWSGLNGSVSVCVTSTSGANSRIASATASSAAVSIVQRVVAEVQAAEARAEMRGRGLGLGVAQPLDVLDRLALLLPQLARLAALAVAQRDHLRDPAGGGGNRDRAAGPPDEVRRVRADHLDPPAHHGASPASRRVFVTAIVITSSSLKPAARNWSAISARPSSTGGLKV